jgi:hypothetical protein
VIEPDLRQTTIDESAAAAARVPYFPFAGWINRQQQAVID